jgi:hypothetical protein
LGVAAGELQHGGAELDPGQPDALRVVGEVAAGADSDLQGVAAGLGADPLAAVAKQPPFPEGDLLVVVAGVLVPVAAQLLCPLVADLPWHAGSSFATTDAGWWREPLFYSTIVATIEG